jgi:hypothetical protein
MTGSEELAQLEAQQGLLTAALRAMLEGTWCGEGSAAAFLQAIDPSLTDLACTPPRLASAAPAATGPAFLAGFDPDTAMPRQSTSWTCSACSLSWVLRAVQLAPHVDEHLAVQLIGSPHNINATYGLMDGSGAHLRRVLAEHGQNSSQAWLNFDQAYTIYATTPGCIAGGGWYHWVAVRGVSGADLSIANSAPGYRGVHSTLSREQFNALGPFSCVWLTP